MFQCSRHHIFESNPSQRVVVYIAQFYRRYRWRPCSIVLVACRLVDSPTDLHHNVTSPRQRCSDLRQTHPSRSKIPLTCGSWLLARIIHLSFSTPSTDAPISLSARSSIATIESTTELASPRRLHYHKRRHCLRSHKHSFNCCRFSFHSCSNGTLSGTIDSIRM